MKTTITVLLFLGISLNVHTQLKKLPILKATSANNYTRIAPEVLSSRSATTVSMVTEFPRQHSNLRAALNEKLTAKKLETKNAHIYFRGEYNHHDYIGLRPNSRGGYLLINFKSVIDKTYRITLDVDASITSQCKNAKLQVFNRSTAIALPIQKGQNVLDFLVKAVSSSGWVYLDAITSRSLTCDGELYNKAKHGLSGGFNFNKVEIKELVN